MALPIPLLLGILQVLPALISAVESLFGSGTGAKKKAVVIELAKTAIGVTQQLSTGGQKETWDQIATPLSETVDKLAAVMFPNEDTPDYTKPSET